MKLEQFSSMKILEHMDLAKAIVAGGNPYPISYEIDPSNACNHECVWCMYEDFRSSNCATIPKILFRSIVDQIIELGAMSITFTGGGEPLVNPLTLEMIPYIKGRGVSVALVTNGGLLDHNKCKIIAESCSYIRVSIDAACRETHDKLHQSKNKVVDNYENTIRNIRWVKEWKIRLQSQITIGTGFLVHPENVSEIYHFAEQMREIGVDYVQIRPVCTLNYDERRLIVEKSKDQIDRALKLTTGKFNIIPMLHRFDEIVATERTYSVCRGHALVGTIGADGNVYLCCQLKGNEKYILGNLNESSFKDIWNGQRKKDVMRELDLSKCPPCRQNKYNEILEYLANKNKVHTEFL